MLKKLSRKTNNTYFQIIVYCILFSATCFQNSVFANDKIRMFSSSIIGQDHSIKAVILANNVILVARDENGLLSYNQIEDGCYTLHNTFNFCAKSGIIQSIIKDVESYHNTHETFFNEQTLECNIFKFKIAKKFFIDKEKIKHVKYQIFIPNYNDILYLVVAPMYYNKDNEIKRYFSAFLLSQNNQIGCSNIRYFAKLYSIDEYEKFKLKIEDIEVIEPIPDLKKHRPYFIIIKTMASYIAKLDESLKNQEEMERIIEMEEYFDNTLSRQEENLIKSFKKDSEE